jgi:hypothetical protein
MSSASSVDSDSHSESQSVLVRIAEICTGLRTVIDSANLTVTNGTLKALNDITIELRAVSFEFDINRDWLKGVLFKYLYPDRYSVHERTKACKITWVRLNHITILLIR